MQAGESQGTRIPHYSFKEGIYWLALVSSPGYSLLAHVYDLGLKVKGHMFILHKFHITMLMCMKRRA